MKQDPQVKELKKSIRVLADKGDLESLLALFDKSRQLSALGVGVLLANKTVTFLEQK